MIKSEKFKTIIEKWLSEHATKSDNHYPWTLETKAGPLRISIDEPEKRAKVLSVFCCFDNPKKGYEYVYSYSTWGTSNKYSGKFNFHFFSTAGTAKELANTVIFHLKELL